MARVNEGLPPPIKPNRRQEMRFALRALEERNYRLLFWPQTLSLCGTWMQNTAQGWLIYRLSDSPGWLGTITFLTLFPIFFLSLWAGVVGDRHPRKWILWLVNAAAGIQAFALGYLTLTGHISVHLIALFATFLGILNSFEIPNRQAFVLDLVTREKLPSAVALNSTAFNIARLVGPLMAGVLIPWKGEGICFVLNSLTYLPILFSLFFLQVPGPSDHHRGIGLWVSLKGGVRYALASPELRPALLLVAFASFSGVWFPAFLPVFAESLATPGARLDEPMVLGILVASVAMGSLLGAYSVAKKTDGRQMGRRVVLGAFALTLGMPLFAMVHHLILAVPVLAGLGFSMVTLNVGTNTLVQTVTPDELRGRISSVYTVAFLGIGPVGALAAGFAAENVGISKVLIYSGLMGFLLILAPARGVFRSRAVSRPAQSPGTFE
jgi:MFS family permease